MDGSITKEKDTAEKKKNEMIGEIYWEKHLPATFNSPESIKAFGENVARRKAELGISGIQLAKKLGHSHTWIQEIEAGKINKIDIQLMMKFSDALDCTPPYLLGFVKDPYAVRCDEQGRQILSPINMPKTLEEDREIGLIWDLIDKDNEMRKLLIQIAISDSNVRTLIKNQIVNFFHYQQNAEKKTNLSVAK